LRSVALVDSVSTGPRLTDQLTIRKFSRNGKRNEHCSLDSARESSTSQNPPGGKAAPGRHQPFGSCRSHTRAPSEHRLPLSGSSGLRSRRVGKSETSERRHQELLPLRRDRPVGARGLGSGQRWRGSRPRFLSTAAASLRAIRRPCQRVPPGRSGSRPRSSCHLLSSMGLCSARDLDDGPRRSGQFGHQMEESRNGVDWWISLRRSNELGRVVEDANDGSGGTP
jgi:hypothetical protein